MFLYAVTSRDLALTQIDLDLLSVGSHWIQVSVRTFFDHARASTRQVDCQLEVTSRPSCHFSQLFFVRLGELFMETDIYQDLIAPHVHRLRHCLEFIAPAVLLQCFH